MGISVEQCRSGFVNAKDALSRFKDQFSNMMSVAPITTTMPYCEKLATILGAKTLIVVPKLKQIVTQYKMWNEVLFYLTQIMYYNVYIYIYIYSIAYKAKERM